MSCALLGLLLTAVLAVSVSAQPTSPPVVKEEINVALTTVEFVAIDSKGHPVSGLDPKSLVLLEDGREQPITNFAEFRRTSPGETKAVGAPEYVSFFFDDSSLTPQVRRKILAAVDQYAKSAAPRGAKIELVSWNQSLDVMLSATDDLPAISAALDKLGKRVPAGSMREAERRRLEQNISTMIADGEATDTGPPMSLSLILAGVKPYAEERARMVERTSTAFGQYLASLERTPGRKTVVFISESLPSRPGSEMFQYIQSLTDRLSNDTGSKYNAAARRSSEHMDEGRLQKGELIRAVGQRAVASHAVIYSLNPSVPGESRSGTVERTEVSSSSSDFAAGLGGVDGLQILANTTGGYAFIGMTPTLALQRIDEEVASYYSVAYHGTSPSSHKIELKTTQPGVKIRHGQTFATTTVTRQAESTEPVDLDDFSSENKLNISLQRGTSTVEGDAKKVQLKILIPVDSLQLTQEPSGEFGGGFSIYIQFNNREGDVTGINKQSHQLRWTAEQRAAAKGRTITYVSDVMIRGGRDLVNVRVVDDQSHDSGFAKIDLSGS
jgi:VWFA-related protein